MTATLLEILMILSLGVLGGTGTGLLIGFLLKKQTRDWASMQEKDKIATVLLIIACSAIIMAFLAWYLYWYPAT